MSKETIDLLLTIITIGERGLLGVVLFSHLLERHPIIIRRIKQLKSKFK